MQVSWARMSPQTHIGVERAPGSGNRIRLLSYNIQVAIPYSRYRHYLTQSWRHVLPFRGRTANLERISQFIKPFDIVGLQELDVGSLRSNYVNQAHYLALRAGFRYWFTRVNRDLGHLARHGMALLSRIAPRHVYSHRLPGRIPGRGALTAEFGGGPEPLLVVVVHLALGKKARRRQIDYLAAEIRRREHVVVMGDFNCRLEDEEFRHLLDSTHLCAPEVEHRTFPSWRPRLGLDHILVTPGLEVEHTQVYPVAHSDHLPIAVEVKVPASVGLWTAGAPPAEHTLGTLAV